MALQTSGAITLQNVQTEFGGSNPIGINEYYAGGSYVPSGTSGTYGSVPSSGTISLQNFYGTTSYTPSIEDLFWVLPYTGNGSSQTLKVPMRLAGQGHLFWFKAYYNNYNHLIFDTQRSNSGFYLSTSSGTNTPESFDGQTFQGFSNYSNFGEITLGTSSSVNQSGIDYSVHIFSKYPKFFDMVTYTGTGVGSDGSPYSTRLVAHSLGVTPHVVIVKARDTLSVPSAWFTRHESVVNSAGVLALDESGLTNYGAGTIGSSTDSFINVGANANQSGKRYIAYLFASDAGGFGANGTESIIKCGSYTGNGSGYVNVDLGWEPQYLLIKCTTGSMSDVNDWFIFDTTRGMVMARDTNREGAFFTRANSTSGYDTSSSATGYAALRPNGFQIIGNTAINRTGQTHLYIAIRRGPLNTPTSVGKVFQQRFLTRNVLYGFDWPVNLSIQTVSDGATSDVGLTWDSKRGASLNLALRTNSIDTETNVGTVNLRYRYSSGITSNRSISQDYTNYTPIAYNWRMARGFFDISHYIGTGDGNTQNVPHNLGVAPELMIIKNLTYPEQGFVYCKWHEISYYDAARLYASNANQQSYRTTSNWGATDPTSSVFTVKDINVNSLNSVHIAYLFATCPGVSKVGYWIGTGNTPQTINCGFTSGVQLLIVKAVSVSGAWIVLDNYRGINSGTEPWYELDGANSGQTVGRNLITQGTSGFTVESYDVTTPGWPINRSGVRYIFYAVAAS